MVDSMTDPIIADPRAFFDKMFDAEVLVNNGTPPSMESDLNIPKKFEDAFADQTQMEKIPQLQSLSASSLKDGKLVRFLGMVQDTSLSQEIYVGMTRSNDKYSFHRYGGDVPNGIDVRRDVILDERSNIYVTSVPGCANWLSSPDSLESLSLEENSALRGDKMRISAYGQREVGVVVKCYLRAEESLKVCDLIEVVGVLEISEDTEGDEVSPSVAIHAVTIQKKQLKDLVVQKYGRLSSDQVEKARGLFIKHVANLLEGDSLAAKSVLLNITSVLTHRNPVPLGCLPLNIYNVSPEATKNLKNFLKSVLPAVAFESMSIENLNSQRIFPKSDGETLSAGRGQLVSRTALVIDDSNMNEGQLQDLGVRNLRFLSRLAVAQKLAFEFPYHEFEIDTDIPILVLGNSKTLLPVTIAFPHIKGEGKSSVLTQEDFTMLRVYLSHISGLNITISESESVEMQNEFVRQRKGNGGKNIDEGWFGIRIVVAKGLCRINGREFVSGEDWRDSLELCAQVESRQK